MLKKKSIKKKTHDFSVLERFLKEKGECWEKEYVFHPTRRWRIDFAIVSSKIAIEIEGGIWTMGRHTHPTGFVKDMEKYNNLAILGWSLLRYSPKELKENKPIEGIIELWEHRQLMDGK